MDAEDVGAVAATALLDPTAHGRKAWTVTGPRALTYHQVADILSAELGRPIRYTRPSLPRYIRHAHGSLGMPWGMVVVTSAIYTTARLGLAAGLTDDTHTPSRTRPDRLHRIRPSVDASPDDSDEVPSRLFAHAV